MNLPPSLKTFADIEKDWTLPFSGNLLTPQHDRILENKANRDLGFYEITLRDDQVYASLQQRFALQTSLEWSIEPGGDTAQDMAAYEFIKVMIDRLKFDQVTELMLYGLFYGFSVAELMLVMDGGRVDLDYSQDGIRVRNRRRFWFDREFRVRLRTPGNYEGEIVDPTRIWSFSLGASHSDDPYGCGLGYWLYWPAFFKRGNMRLWLQNLEAEATRRPVAKYPNNASPDEQLDALEAAKALGEGKPFAVSENTIVELLGNMAQGGTYERLWEACNQAISKIVLSQTMTLDDGSSQSQAEVHKEVLDSIVKKDADIICQTFNDQVIDRFCGWNFENATPPRIWRVPSDSTDRKLEAEIDSILIANGWEPSPNRILTVFGSDYEKKISPVTVETLPGQFNAPRQIRSGGIYEFAEAQQDGVDLFVARAVEKARPSIRKWIDVLRKQLQNAETLEEFAESLPELYNDLDGDELEGVFAQAMQASQLAGIYESQEAQGG